MNRIIEAWHATKGWRTLSASIAVAVAGVLQSTDWTFIRRTGSVRSWSGSA
jgi:hypothetical protein